MTRVHALRIPFRLEIGPGKTLDRFAYVYLLVGPRVVLIDSGVAGAERAIVEQLQAMGREPNDLALVVLTHAHPDHIGGLLGLTKTLGVQVAAHAEAISWVEDVERQYRERPVPCFQTLVAGSVEVDRPLQDGDTLDLGDGQSLRVLHTPGHASGHIALWNREEGILFSGDAIPSAGALPIYDDPLVLLRSLERLRSLIGLRTLFSSWEDPHEGDVYAVIDAGIAYLRQVHRAVLDQQARGSLGDSKSLTASVLAALGLGAVPLNPLLVRTIEAHCRQADREELQA
jgi:glyoxylase-like metal-dependent hydrolase (beta-lactamase superfamily II)